jgi:hypothetical protein
MKYLMEERQCDPFEADDEKQTAIHALIRSNKVSYHHPDCVRFFNAWKSRLIQSPYLILTLQAASVSSDDEDEDRPSSFAVVLCRLFVDSICACSPEQRKQILATLQASTQ